jgi:hypothetical protein
MSIEQLFSKRRQIRQAWDFERVPSTELITDLLQRSINIAPSKQNLFPFKIHAFGPDNVEERDIISQICCLWDKGAVNDFDVDRDSGVRDSYKKAPWVLVFESRLCEPNTFIKEYSDWVGEESYYKRFTQCDPNRYRNLCNTKLTSIEVGMFIQTLAGLCLENDLAISYIRSFPDWVWKEREEYYKKDTNKQGLDWDSLPCITEQPLMVVQIGYKAEIEDPLMSTVEVDGVIYTSKNKNGFMLEDKPDLDTVVNIYNRN